MSSRALNIIDNLYSMTGVKQSCCLNLHFFWLLVRLSIFHTDHWDFLFCELPLYILCPFELLAF